ncbi:class I SAM-dependent DNA methyltransferase [Edaphobacter albus]|uniref:class I SAM-dependent DNA methyltransferase n=1 Tax=Edaphobacter sp. 4G125 TaxID=2763071 RepID=UPI001645F3E2|nr:class I SAM-dependent methyltransferase [Edaphobacter sp. 4G125]QNI37659.1 methyltransferase domain-containing protein [Edaphobacter sp. 4G125]
MIHAIPNRVAALAFDRLAPDYDKKFTETSVGRAQRIAVWECAQHVFTPHSRLLELNCGTGEDALHFARQGFHVTACDVSTAMIAEARKKALLEGVSDRVRFYVQATERISEVAHEQPFSGVFSNFSGLNCVRNLDDIAEALAPLLLPRSPTLLCFSARYCVWEMVWYLLRGDTSRAFRRWNGYHETCLSDVTLPIYYPLCSGIRKSFSRHFRLISITGIGVTVPPSYADSWISQRPRLLHLFEITDAAIRRFPGLRVLGDHMLLHLERLPA